MNGNELRNEMERCKTLGLLVDSLHRVASSGGIDLVVGIGDDDRVIPKEFYGDLSGDAKAMIFNLVKARYDHLYRESKKRVQTLILSDNGDAPEKVSV